MVTKIGMIGFNPGNGHPFSFSAIVNGFDERAMRDAGWGVIADYLAPRDRVDFGVPGAAVTHVWAPDRAVADQIRRASRVEHRVEAPGEMLGEVDAVMIARDDWQGHLELALPFLEAGIPTFVDKPLTLDEGELSRLRPYLESGTLASWSGLRFAPELDGPAAADEPPTLLRGAGPGGWDTYAIHLLEPALRIARQPPRAVVPLTCGHPSAAVELEGGGLVQIDVLGDARVPFCLDLAGRSGIRRIELADRFTAFRRSVAHFVSMVERRAPVVPPEDTIAVVRTLIAGREALRTGRRTPITTPPHSP